MLRREDQRRKTHRVLNRLAPTRRLSREFSGAADTPAIIATPAPQLSACYPGRESTSLPRVSPTTQGKMTLGTCKRHAPIAARLYGFTRRFTRHRMPGMNCLHVAYWIVAVSASAFIGLYCMEIFEIDGVTGPRLLQQQWLNFLGALIGWAVLWPLGLRYVGCLSATGCPGTAADGWTLLAALVAFLGITGYIPYTVINTITGAIGALRWLALFLAAWLKAHAGKVE
jgi:hypothetical protein